MSLSVTMNFYIHGGQVKTHNVKAPNVNVTIHSRRNVLRTRCTSEDSLFEVKSHLYVQDLFGWWHLVRQATRCTAGNCCVTQDTVPDISISVSFCCCVYQLKNLVCRAHLSRLETSNFRLSVVLINQFILVFCRWVCHKNSWHGHC